MDNNNEPMGGAPAPAEPIAPVEPTPAEPAAPAEPVAPTDVDVNETVTPAPTAAPVATPAQPTAAPVAAPTPRVFTPDMQSSAQSKTEPKPEKKKAKKGPLIAGIAVGGALVLGGGGFGVAYAITSQPENASLMAISNFISQDNIGLSGTFNIKGDMNGDMDVKLTLDAAGNADLEGNVSASIEVTYDGKTYKLSLSSVYIKDNTIYIRIDELNKLFEDLVEMIKPNLPKDDVTGFYGKVETMLRELVGEIDGQYWRINYDELIDATEGLTKKQKAAYKAFYSCTRNVISDEYNKREEYIDLYKANSFLSFSNYEGKRAQGLEKSGKLYSVKVDTKKLEAFLTSATKRNFAGELNKCSEDMYEALGHKSSSKDDDDYEVELGDVDYPDEMVISVDGVLKHRLTGVYLYDASEKNDATAEVTITFNYDKKNITAPNSSKDVKELYDLIQTDVQEFLTALREYQMAQYYDGSTGGYDII